MTFQITSVMQNQTTIRGFVKLKQFQKSGKNWVGQDPTRIIFFGGEMFFFCVLCVVFMFPNLKKKKKN